MINLEFITRILLFFIITIQSIEYVYLNSKIKTEMWTSNLFFNSNLKSAVLRILTNILTKRGFTILLILRLLLTLVTLVYPSFIVFLIIMTITILIHLPWKGNFNGGSDYMLMVLILGLFIEGAGRSYFNFSNPGLTFIAISSIYSYFKAGIVKIIQPEWVLGSGLKSMLQISCYKNPTGIFKLILDQKELIKLISWIVILFEISFPLILIFKDLLVIYLIFGFLFHLVIVYLLGLNRFFWSWVSTYPSIYYLCSII